MSQAESEVRWRGLGASGSVRGEAAQSAQLSRVYITSVGTVESPEKIIILIEKTGRGRRFRIIERIN